MRIKLLFIVCLLSSSIIAQEVISELSSNPILINENWESNTSKSVLDLPFVDDFSYDSPVVNNDLWEQSSVFVNRTYPINPPTIGVATFDGLDEYGLARDFSQLNPSEPSDTLLSQEIDLSLIDSAYFLFFYQPKGIGDKPQIGDSLILEFKNMNSDWDMVWYNICDTIISEFTKEVIILKSSDYLTSFFQFRFRNYATISGNFDHWNIDYVKLDEFQNSSDTSTLNDVSFVYNSSSFLKRYFEMPWTHFMNNESSELKDSIDILIRNNNASINVDYQYNVFENGNLLETFPSIGTGWRNYTIYDYDSIGNFSHNPSIFIDDGVFTSFQVDSATFVVQNVIATSLSDNKENDTLYHVQNFYNHFSYDDGTAEQAYGINIDGAKLAYEFKLNRPDTLRAVQMYFPQMLSSVSNIPFELTIWNDNNGQPGDTLYTQTVIPVHTENGKYHSYYIDQPFRIVGTFYVGWEQITDDLLNIGLDKNNESNSYMFFNVGSSWNNSSFPGSWMIRPVLSRNQIISSVAEIKTSFKIYPNPSSEIIIIESQNDRSQISIFNMQGVLVKQQMTSDVITKVNVSDLSSSVYFVEVANENGKQYQKIIVK